MQVQRIKLGICNFSGNIDLSQLQLLYLTLSCMSSFILSQFKIHVSNFIPQCTPYINFSSFCPKVCFYFSREKERLGFYNERVCILPESL